MSIKITEKLRCQKICDAKNSTIGKATEYKKSGSSELQKSYVKFGGGTNGGRNGGTEPSRRSPVVRNFSWEPPRRSPAVQIISSHDF